MVIERKILLRSRPEQDFELGYTKALFTRKENNKTNIQTIYCNKTASLLGEALYVIIIH
jgi:hypothetical protein